MKYIVKYKICGKEHKTRVEAGTYGHAEYKVRKSLLIISCKSDEEETVSTLKKLFGMEE